MRFWLGVILCALVLRPVAAFSPYYSNGKPARWDFNYAGNDPRAFNHATKAIRFSLGNSATVANRTAELNAIRASFAQWQAIPGTIIKFEEGGALPASVTDIVQDGTNSVFWTTAATVAGVDMTGRSGYTVIFLDAENRIMEADIALNARIFSWFTDINNTASGAQFVEITALHEIGHLLGVDHTPVGAATVVDGGPGLGPALGLSSDEIAAARFLYPAPASAGEVGAITGTVLMNGVGIRGAIVTAETTTGITISSTPSDELGTYRLPALPPGAYNVRVSPMDPASASVFNSLFRPQDIFDGFGSAQTLFKPTENTAATVTAGATATLNFTVVAGEPPFRIQQLSKPTTLANAPSAVRYGVAIAPGQSVYLGVSGAALPADATLSITGDGITISERSYQPNRLHGIQHLLSARVTVATNATPGLRTIFVRRGTDVAYANGFLEIYPHTPDYNFDGLDDRFQRQYFPMFTAAEAAPNSDPDADRFSNAFEALTGSNPTNASSFNLFLDQLEFVRGSPRLTWRADVGKQYQVYGRNDVASGGWQTIGSAVTATTNSASQVDGSGLSDRKFYKLRLLP